MSSSTLKPANPTILSLPDDVLSKIFSHLAKHAKYTLQGSLDAVSLARTNTRFQRVFASRLTRITPITENADAPTFSEENMGALVEIAAGRLRELHVPDGDHAFVSQLPRLCPNLEAISYFEIHHDPLSSQQPCPSSSEGSDSDGDNLDALVVIGYANDAENNADGNGVEGDNSNAVSVHGGSENDNNEHSDNENGNDNDGYDGDSHDNSADDNLVNDDPANNSLANNNPANDSHINDSDSNDDGNSEHNNSNGTNSDAAESDGASNDGANSDAASSHEGHDDDSDHGIYLSEVSISRNRSNGCDIVLVLPRLQLRVLSITRPSDAFFDNMKHHTLEELHLHRVTRHQLARVIPLLSHTPRRLTVTVHDYEPLISDSKRILRFIDALIPFVSQIVSLTLHIPFRRGLETYLENVLHRWHHSEFPEQAASLIASARRNTCSSKCTVVNLKGEIAFRVLSAVNPKASITLTRTRVTVRDDGEGPYFIGLPLDDDFLQADVTRLEEAYILKQGRRLEHICNPDWGFRLADHKLRVVRTSDARILNIIRLSTERLELLCKGLQEVSDWTFLSGVRELYLLGLPGRFFDKPLGKTTDVFETLAHMVDAFRGELIWVGIYCSLDFRGCEYLDDLVETAKAVKGAIERFISRGGDAGTLQSYIESVLRHSESLRSN